MVGSFAKWNTGVYCWYNKANGKVYVGSSSSSLIGRYKSYRKDFVNGKCHNILLERAWKKYGSKVVVFRVLEECPPDKCLEREQWWIDYYDATNRANGYNLCPTAGSCKGARHGKPMSEARKQEIAARMMGNKHFEGKTHTKATREKLSRIATGKPVRDTTRLKLSEANKGKKRTPESIAKTADFNRGKPRSEDTKAKISKSNTGKKHSDDAKNKMSLAKLGKKFSDSVRENMSIAHVGVPWSEARRQSWLNSQVANVPELDKVEVVCRCGKLFFLKKYVFHQRKNRSKSGLIFCSPQCSGKHSRE